VVAQILGLLLSTVKVMKALILTKNGVGYILGDFFTNSSGHPASGPVDENNFRSVVSVE
jgi:hypothetical protein